MFCPLQSGFSVRNKPMTIREQLEERELEYLSPYATFSRDSQGRKRQDQNVISGPYFSATGTGFCTASRFGG